MLRALASRTSALNFATTSTRGIHVSASALAAVIEFPLPDLGEKIPECEVLEWLVDIGDEVDEWDMIARVQSDKAAYDVVIPYTGTITALHWKVGELAKTGAPLVSIDVEGDVDPEDLAAVTEPESPPAAEPESAPPTPVETEGGYTPSISFPDRKAAAAAPASGAKLEGVPDNLVEGSGSWLSDKYAPSASPHTLATPFARGLAKSNGIDIATVRGTGPGGRVLVSDIVAAASPAGATQAAPAKAAPTTTATGDLSGKGAQYTEKLTGIRKAMVGSMNDSLTIPHFGYKDELVMDNLIDLRNNLKGTAEALGEKLSFMPFFIKAASVAMNEYPVINSSLSDDQSEIIFHSNHNIGVAVDTPAGLTVPNIKAVQDKSILEIAKELNRLIEAGRTNKLSMDDLTDTTFTISNIGAVGGTYMNPVIAKPQVAIVAIGKTQALPRFDENDNVVKTHVLAHSWAGDHRVIDGATMARFSNLWKTALETPESMLLFLR